MVGLGKIFGRSVKSFGRPGQFLKVWKKIRNVREKISEKMYGKNSRGSKILATMGREDFLKFYLDPQNACCPSNAPPPQILRPSAATGAGKCIHLLYTYLMFQPNTTAFAFFVKLQTTIKRLIRELSHGHSLWTTSL